MKQIGILMPIFSLPNKYGIGSLGKEAFQFIDFLNKAEIDLWQVLPTNPTSYGDSPYQSFSVHAQNPYFIDLELLVKDKLLKKEDLLDSGLADDSHYVNYGNMFNIKMKLLNKAYEKHKKFEKEFEKFKEENEWLQDFAMFMALKESHGFKSFHTWEKKYKFRDEAALKEFYEKHKDKVEAIKFIQYLYAKQWNDVHQYALSKNVKIVGDMPIYVALDSCDVWAKPKNFLLDHNYNPTVVAGVPPDYFCADGQLWGNPIYDYRKMARDNYSWWVGRVGSALKYFDTIRIDHFRGFAGYYCVPAGEKTARNGYWKKGPGMKLFKAINESLDYPHIIAENLGILGPDVDKLIKDTNYPGMKILQFEMYSKENLANLKKSSPNNIMYPGTHDNNTFIGWYKNEASVQEKLNVQKELGFKSEKKLTGQLLKYCYSFPFDTVVIAYHDVIGCDGYARLNFPGHTGNFWRYRFQKDDFKASTANKLKALKEMH